MDADVDLLSGYDAIARFLGITARQAKHRALSGAFPTFKQGGVRCATKSGLRAYLARQMAQAERSAGQ